MSRDLGRNDPCWCGSGRKYKRCHLSADQKKRRHEHSLATIYEWVAFHGRALRESALAGLPPDAVAAAAAEYFERPPEGPLDDPGFVDWLLYDGASPRIAAVPIDEASESAERQQALRVQLAATHATLVEVLERKRGKGLRLKDRLSGRTVFVRDQALLEQLEPMEVVRGRVADVEEQPILLDGWRRVRFRARKAAIASLLKVMEAAELPEDDVEARAAWLVDQAPQLHRALAAISETK